MSVSSLFMDTLPEQSKDMAQEPMSVDRPADSVQAIELNVHTHSENTDLQAASTTSKNAGLSAPATTSENSSLATPSTRGNTGLATLSTAMANSSLSSVNADLPGLSTTNQNDVICSTAQNVANDGSESDTDIIILPPPSTKQECTEESEIIQTDFITIPFPEAETARVKIISDEIITPSSFQNKVEIDQRQSNTQSLTTVLKSSQIETDKSPSNQKKISPTGIISSSTRRTKIVQYSPEIVSHNFKAPYPVHTSVVIEEVESEENESTLSADMSQLDNSHCPERQQCSNSQHSSTITASENIHNNKSASENVQDTEDILLVKQHSEEATIEEPQNTLYVEDKGPRIYEVPENFTSKPLNPTYLSYAFKDLPIFGRPRTKAELPEFQRNKIKEFVGGGLDDEDFDNLASYCCPDNLRTGNELIMQSSPGQGFYPSELDSLSHKNKQLSSTHNLNIVRKLKLRIEKDTKNLYSKRYKYRGVRMIPLSTEDEDGTPVVTIGQPILPGKELLFVIRWYRPFPYNPKDRFGYRSRHSVFSNNIVLLGRHKLSLLRDRVVCANDVDMRVDVSDRPDDLPRSSAKELFPSGFLFINNVFYVDKRPGCVDYTAPLRRWAKTRGIGDFPCRDMCEVRLDELVVKLGHPEVYVHQGNCEHLFTISEVRLVSAADPLRLAAYPAHSMLSQHQTIYCTTCAEFGAKWIVVGCPRVPFDPAFFCEKCFKMYLYKDGQKIGNFKAYLYRGNEINSLKPQS